ncbi:MAG: hypothetical protein DMF55_11650, partial [Acidobacteria bacterium]
MAMRMRGLESDADQSMRRSVYPLVFAALLLLPGAGSSQTTTKEPSKKERIAAFPKEDRKWLTEFVAPIVLPEEEKLFLELTDPHQREIFKEEFWKRREKDGLASPMGPGYRQRYEHFRDLASTAYDGLSSDAGRMVLRLGEPSRIEEFPECSDALRHVEEWTYATASGGAKQFLFYRPTYGGVRKVWSPAFGDKELLQPASCLTTLQELCMPASAPV